MNPEIAKSLPQDLEAERSILGVALLDNRSLALAAERLRTEDFFLPQHRHIFEAMLRLQDENQPIDLVTLSEALQKTEALELAGGVPYVSQLADGMPRTANVDHYARIVRDKAALRKAAYYADQLFQLAMSPQCEAPRLADQAVEFFVTLSESCAGQRSTVTDRDAAISLLASFDSPERKLRIDSGIEKLDRSTGGFLGGDLILVTADTGVGKTFFGMQVKRRACHAGLHGLYASGEMLAEHLMSRHLSSETAVPYWKFRRVDRFTLDEVSQLMLAASRQCTTCRILDGDLSLAGIRTKSRGMSERDELRWLIVDYDELVEVHGCKDEWDEQRVLIRSLKKIAKQLRIPVFLISQLKKQLSRKEGAAPNLNDLYGSGAKKKHATMVIFIDRPFVEKLAGDEAAASIWLLKNRDGAQGKVDCIFNKRTLSFDEAPEGA
jgi:replicative DNA helicase